MQTARPVTKPNKQRKMLYDAPDHVRHKLLAAHLSPTLRATHIVRSFPVRSGDTVRVTRGDHKGFEGKVSRIDVQKYRIYVDGLTRDKVDGTTISVPVHPSKLMITQLNLDDKWRKKVLERKQKTPRKPRERAKKTKPETPKVETAPKAETVELPAEVVEPKPVEEKVPVVEKPEEAAAVAEKPEKKRVSTPRKRTKKAPEEKSEIEAAEAEVELTPKKERKTTKRKTAKKSEKGEE